MAENSTTYIDPSSQVTDSKIETGARVYKHCYVSGCHLSEGSIVGDYSRVERTRLGQRVRLQRYQVIYDSAIGRNTYTGRNFTAWHCEIGSFCSISWNVSIGGANHDYRRITTHAMLYAPEFGFLNGREAAYDRFDEECIVGNDVWIGCNVVVQRGVHVGNGAVIGSGAIVTRDVEPYAIVVGVPAKKVGERFSKELARRVEQTRWWELPDHVIRPHLDLFSAVADESSVARIESLCREHRDQQK